MRRRLDTELVRRGLATSRTEAQAAVDAGLVTVGGRPAAKSSTMVADSEPVALAAPLPALIIPAMMDLNVHDRRADALRRARHRARISVHNLFVREMLRADDDPTPALETAV